MNELERVDFFVSYNNADVEWAVWIAWEVEAAGYSTIIQEWDFVPGNDFVIRMQTATEKADRTISVLSPSYLTAEYTQPEWAAALQKDPTGEKQSLVFVRVRDCTVPGMLAGRIAIDLRGKAYDDARTQLIEGLREGRRKPLQPPRFPGGPGDAQASVFPAGSRLDGTKAWPIFPFVLGVVALAVVASAAVAIRSAINSAVTPTPSLSSSASVVDACRLLVVSGSALIPLPSAIKPEQLDVMTTGSAATKACGPDMKRASRREMARLAKVPGCVWLEEDAGIEYENYLENGVVRAHKNGSTNPLVKCAAVCQACGRN